MRVLFLSAYDSDSHRRWREGLKKNFREWEWKELILPPRFFTWRLRGAPLHWYWREKKALEAPYSFAVVDSTVELASLRGLVPQLTQVPTLLYFHENQFEYPIRNPSLERERVHLALVNVYSALAADKVAFNSEFNRQSFLKGLSKFLDRVPDYSPKKIVEAIEKKSEVVPVPLEESWWELANIPRGGEFTILWNHRWEYDKGPERFFSALRILKKKGVKFKINVVGRTFREVPAVFREAREEFREEIQRWGYLAPGEYREAVAESHAVVSTALHEFQGLSVLEAASAGCFPVVPDRLAYREFFPPQCRYPSSVKNPEREAEDLAEHLIYLSDNLEKIDKTISENLKFLSWERLRERYLSLFREVCSLNRRAREVGEDEGLRTGNRDLEH